MTDATTAQDQVRSISTKCLERVILSAALALDQSSVSPVTCRLEQQIYQATIGRGTSITEYVSKMQSLTQALADTIRAETLKQVTWIPPPHHSTSPAVALRPESTNLSGCKAVLRILGTFNAFSQFFGTSIDEMSACLLLRTIKREVDMIEVNAVALGLAAGPSLRTQLAGTKSRVPRAVPARLRAGVLAQLRRECETGVPEDAPASANRRPRHESLSQTLRFAQHALDAKFKHVNSLVMDVYELYSSRLFDVINMVRPTDYQQLMPHLATTERLFNHLLGLNMFRAYANYNRMHNVEHSRAVLDAIHQRYANTLPWRTPGTPSLPSDVSMSAAEFIGIFRGAMDGTLTDKDITGYIMKPLVIPVAVDDPEAGYALGEYYDWVVDGFCEKRMTYRQAIPHFKLISVARSFVVPRWKFELTPKDAALKLLTSASQVACEKVLGGASTVS